MIHIQQTCFFLIIITFIGPGMSALNMFKLVNFNIEVLFIGSVIPLLFFNSFTRYHSGFSLGYLVSRNILSIVTYGFLNFMMIVSTLNGSSFYEEIYDNKWIAILRPALSFSMFVFAIQLGSNRLSVRMWKDCLYISTLLAAVGQILNVIFFSFFDSLHGKETAYVTGILQQRNQAAMILAGLCFVSIAYDRIRLADVFLLTTSILGILSTLSRMGMIFCLCLVLVYFYKIPKISKRMSRNVVLLFFLTATSISLGWQWLPSLISGNPIYHRSENSNRLESIQQLGLEVFMEKERLRLIDLSTQSFIEHPMTGHGAWFFVSSGFAVHGGPHNEFLRYGLDFGVIGLVSFSLFVFGGIVVFWKRHFFEGLGFSVFFALCCLFSHCMTEMTPFIILYGLLLGVSTPHPFAVTNLSTRRGLPAHV